MIERTINWYVGQGLRRHMTIYRTLVKTRGGLVERIKEPDCPPDLPNL